LKHARGKYIAVLDAHNRYAEDYLAQCLAVLEETKSACVGGAVFAEGDSWLSRAICATHHSKFAVGNSKWHDPTYEGATDAAWGGFFDRAVLDAVGAWDEELTRNQDDELSLRITRAGHRIWQSPRIKTWYTPRGSVRKLWDQYTQYGYWKVRVIQKHRMPSTVRQLVPAGLVLTLGTTGVLGFIVPGAWIAGASVGALYGAASLSASIATAARTELSFLPILPVLFGCYHFGYGVGFLRGILDFVVKGKGGSARFASVTR
jgi:succinoglycan biosynthesis protein ExoA